MCTAEQLILLRLALMLHCSKRADVLITIGPEGQGSGEISMFQYGRADQTQFKGETRAAPRALNRASRFPSVRARVACWREMARIHAELGDLSRRELAELGLVPSDIPSVARGEYGRDK